MKDSHPYKFDLYTMKMITWNCNGALRKKFLNLSEFGAEIMVIQECEDPERSNDSTYKQWASNYVWTGDNKNKGLGIFCSDSTSLRENGRNRDGVKHFISSRVNDAFDLVAVWNHYNNSPTFGYIGQLWKYLQINKSDMTNCIVAGDFNGNKIWDRPLRWWNHTDVVTEFEEIGIRSLYHEYFKESQGKETQPTFFLQRKIEKPYHIDYVFASRQIISEVASFQVASSNNWLERSDHLPIFIEW